MLLTSESGSTIQIKPTIYQNTRFSGCLHTEYDGGIDDDIISGTRLVGMV